MIFKRINYIFHICTILFISLTFHSCVKENPVNALIPYVRVNFSINPNSIEYNNLNIVGNHAYVTGGYRGIIIYHATLNNYIAFERTSPYNYPNDDNCRVSVDESGLIAVDPCSNTKYILLDGSVYEGEGSLPLKQYRTTFDGTNLSVYN